LAGIGGLGGVGEGEGSGWGVEQKEGGREVGNNGNIFTTEQEGGLCRRRRER